MNIKELINEARSKSKDFDFKYRYWCEQRKKQPDFEWIMLHLEDILGAHYVKAAAQEHIAATSPSEEQK